MTRQTHEPGDRVYKWITKGICLIKERCCHFFQIKFIQPSSESSKVYHLNRLVTSTPREAAKETTVITRLSSATCKCRCLTCLCCCPPSDVLLQLLFWTLSHSQPNPPGWPCWPSLQNSAQMGNRSTPAKKYRHKVLTGLTLAPWNTVLHNNVG